MMYYLHKSIDGVNKCIDNIFEMNINQNTYEQFNSIIFIFIDKIIL